MKQRFGGTDGAAVCGKALFSNDRLQQRPAKSAPVWTTDSFVPRKCKHAIDCVVRAVAWRQRKRGVDAFNERLIKLVGKIEKQPAVDQADAFDERRAVKTAVARTKGRSGGGAMRKVRACIGSLCGQADT